MAAFIIPLAVWLIMSLGIIIPIFLGGMAISFKVIQLLVFTDVGGFPMWSLFVVFILGFIILRKLRKRGYYP